MQRNKHHAILAIVVTSLGFAVIAAILDVRSRKTASPPTMQASKSSFANNSTMCDDAIDEQFDDAPQTSLIAAQNKGKSLLKRGDAVS